MLSKAPKIRSASSVALFLGFLAAAPTAKAADLDVYVTRPAISYGVSCNSPEAQSFPSVWLGHFTGGASQYTGPNGSILLDWRDDRLCFPSRRSCDRWVSRMRRDFHHPEGNFTCLTIR